MNKRQAVILDTVNSCQMDSLYLKSIIEEYYQNKTDEEIDILYDRFDLDLVYPHDE